MSVKELDLGGDESEEAVAKDMSAADASKFSKMGGNVWVNEKMNPISTPLICRVPQKIVIYMRTIERLMVQSGMGSLEFGAFLNGAMNEHGMLVLTDAYFVPKQKVTSVTIDFEEEPPEPKYNGVIHRHPTGCKGFSGTDSGHINKNFDFSLLYEGNDIILGIINIEVHGVRIQLPLKIEVMYPIFNLEENVMSKIKKHESAMMSSCRSEGRPAARTGNPIFGDKRDVRGLLLPGFESDDAPDADTPEEEEDEPEGLIFQCNNCGKVQIVDDFPHVCESCDDVLDMEEMTEIEDITNLDESAQQDYIKLKRDK